MFSNKNEKAHIRRSNSTHNDQENAWPSWKSLYFKMEQRDSIFQKTQGSTQAANTIISKHEEFK